MEPDEYQEQQDSLNVNEQTWRDGSSGGLSNPMKEEDDPQIKNRVWAESLTMEKKKKKPDSLPTAKELSERFGASFAPILVRFKEQIRFEITTPSATLGIPKKLIDLSLNLSSLFMAAADSVNMQLKDSENDPSKKIDLEFMRVDINILNVTADKAYRESEIPSNVFDNSISSEKKYNVINETAQRGLGEEGVVGNPGYDGNWVTVTVYDGINERELDIRFIIYLQVRKLR